MSYIKTYVLLIDGRYVKGFDGLPIGQSGPRTGWYTEPSGRLGTIEYTNDINQAYEISGRINFKSTFDRIISRMSEQDLKFSKLEFIEKTRD